MKKHIKARLVRNAELAKRDAENRCVHCKRPLRKNAGLTFHVLIGPGVMGPCCSMDCMADFIEQRDEAERVGR